MNHHHPSQSSSSNSLLTQALSLEQRIQVDYPIDYQALYIVNHDSQNQNQQLQQPQYHHEQDQDQQLSQQQYQQQLQQQQQEQLQQENVLDPNQQDMIALSEGHNAFTFDPSSFPLYNSSLSLAGSSLAEDVSAESLPDGNEWASYLSMGNFTDGSGTLNMEQLQMVQGDLGNEWPLEQNVAFSFNGQDSSLPLTPGVQNLQHLQPQIQSYPMSPQSHQQQQQQQQQQYQQQQQQQQQQEHEQQLQQQHQQQRLYQLQQQQQLRLQLELASQTQLPQSPAPGIGYSASPLQQHFPHHLHGMNQFASGHSPAQSPLSPGNYAGDDYFSSRQASPGPAASPGSSKIKSRPRPSTAGVRVSQGGIKALFGQSSSKNNRASLDLKSDNSINSSGQQGLTAALIAANQTSAKIGVVATPITSPVRKKKSVKAVSAEIPIINHSIKSASEEMTTDKTQQESTDSSHINTAPTPVLTLAERRAAAAAAAAAGTQRRRSASDSSTTGQRSESVSSTPPSLILPNLGLDNKVKKLVLSSNVTPGSESLPLPSPSILSPSTPSSAPIQIGRITPRHSSSLARTEEQQRQLDAAMERVDFDDVTVAELKEMLRQRGKHGGGKKADLIKRLQSEIDIIRANRQSRSGNMAIPPPLASPTHSLYKTLGGMHIGTPPIHVNNNSIMTAPSNLRYSLYNGMPIGHDVTNAGMTLEPLSSTEGTSHLSNPAWSDEL
ncbi:hypothetical protein BGZ46_006294 [Entomortierella lignicola]|nr:hypothetical protein BGZ46_006294 [Entomortierella lignicola]